MTTEESVSIEVEGEQPQMPEEIMEKPKVEDVPLKPKPKKKAKIRKVIREKSEPKKETKDLQILKTPKTSALKYLFLIIGSGLAILIGLIIAKRFKSQPSSKNKGQVVKHIVEPEPCETKPTSSIRNYFR